MLCEARRMRRVTSILGNTDRNKSEKVLKLKMISHKMDCPFMYIIRYLNRHNHMIRYCL